jgi:hypothetical protein
MNREGLVGRMGLVEIIFWGGLTDLVHLVFLIGLTDLVYPGMPDGLLDLFGLKGLTDVLGRGTVRVLVSLTGL